MDAALRDHDLTVPQYSCLEQLAHRPGLTNATLARGTFVSRQAMHQLLGTLRSADLVQSDGAGRHEHFTLTDTGAKVGDSYTLTSGSRNLTIQIAGEVFDPSGGQAEIIAGQSTLAALDPGLSPDQYDVALTPGTNAQGYADALGAKLGQTYQVNANGSNSSQFFVIIGLVATLTLLLVAVAGLGVLNTVVLQTRERVHDLGVFKAIGMTPRQTIAMVVCSVAGIGLVAGLIAIPAGIAVHNYVLPVMGHAAQTDVPPSVLNVYQPAELVLLALSGLVIAVAGALGPAGWAARTRTAFALRAE